MGAHGRSEKRIPKCLQRPLPLISIPIYSHVANLEFPAPEDKVSFGALTQPHKCEERITYQRGIET